MWQVLRGSLSAFLLGASSVRLPFVWRLGYLLTLSTP